ncbi:MAG: hypothetical protein JWN92_1657 [Candidatus Acidoferrum typicum]|nr:hypothetical protein [Candidatus Acidoferrum typicum]
MINEEIRDWYLGLPDTQKQIFLAVLSYHLTIHGRSFGVDLVGEKQSEAFKGLNELQHQISQHIAGIGLGTDRYPDTVFWQIIHEQAASYGLAAHLTKSIEFARSRNGLK